MNKPRAAVIGSGFGGLALAIRLQSSGFDTVIYEGRDKPGGRAYVWKEQGYTFDAGPTVVTDPACLEELFALSGRKLSDYVELISVDPFYRLCWEDGSTFDYVNDQASLDKQIAARNPDDVAGYQRFLKYSEALFQEGYVKLGHVPFLDFSSMIAAAPQLMKLQAWRSVYAKVSTFVKDEHLRQALSFHTLLVGGSPFATSSIYALIHALERRGGVWFPRGGTGALIAALVKLFQDIGGEIRLSTPVQEIRTSAGRTKGVVTEAGGFEAFDAVASNADIVHTYDKLLKCDPRGRQAAAAVKRKRFSPSLFVVHFGLKTPQPQLRHHTICFGPRYRELITEIYGKNNLAKDFSLYLHSPCASDPGMAPEGGSTHYALSPVPHMGTADIDWAAEGPRYAETILKYLEERYIPNLSRDLVVSRIFTPADFSSELNAHLGSAFSLEPILTQSAFFRTHNRDDKIPNLYFVGAGTHPGAGIPGVVGSAKATAGLMIDDFITAAA
jgi:phytoene desaturase